MLQIKEIINSVFTSKTYILYKEWEDKAWLVDIGDIEPVVSFMDDNRLTAAGVFVTHGHFDHIYGLPSLIERYPECKVYTSEFGKISLASDKLNMSRYHDNSIVFEGNNIVVVHEGDKIRLFEDEPLMQFYETPGHNPGCLTMVLGDFIFTGDAYIPGVGANTQLPHANKEQAHQSLERILKLAEGKTIFSGHQVDNIKNV